MKEADEFMSELASLVIQLQDPQVDIRAAAAEQMSQMAEAARPAAVALVTACGDQPSVSQWAAAALEELGPPPAAAAEALAELAASRQELVAYWAVTLLGRLGPTPDWAGSRASRAEASRADTLLAALVAALDASTHLAVRQRAAWALGKIGLRSEAVAAALQRAGGSSDPRLARLAAEAMTQLK